MKRNKTLRVFLTLAITLVLCLGSITTAFAAPVTGGTPTAPIKPVIAKVFTMPAGTTTPAATFTFSFAAKEVDGSTAAADLLAMPAITSTSVTFSSADAGTTTGNSKTVIKDTNVLSATWTHAGVYTYTVTEATTGYTTAAGETLGYSAAEYDITFYVAFDTVTSTYYITDVVATEVKGDDGIAIVSPGKTTTEPGTDPTNVRMMKFTNTYSKKTGGTDPTANSAFSISKAVTGGMGDPSKYFAFDLNVTAAAGLTGTQTYKVYVVDATNAVVTSTANYAILLTDAYGDYITVTAGTQITINLKHGQKLALMDAEVGTGYAVTEKAVPGYIPSALVTVNGATTAPGGTISGTVNTDLVVPVSPATSILVTEGTDSTVFTNNYPLTTPTGISLANLPFIMMLVVAAGAFVAFVVVKSRKKAY